MPGAFTKREVDQAIELRVPGAEPVRGMLREVRVYSPEHKPSVTVLHIDVDLVTFQRIEDDHLVGFVPGSIDPGVTDYELTSASPIELQLRLEAPLGGEEYLAERVALGVTSDEDTALNSAGSYLWLAVLQEHSSRPGVTLKRGFRSVYVGAGPP